MSLKVFKTHILPLKHKLYRFALTFIKDEEEASDLVQEVLIKAWDNRAKYEQLENIEAWCMKVMRNLALDRLKSSRSKLTDQMKDGFDRSSGESQTPYCTTEMTDTMRTIANFIAGLPEKQRQAIQLRDIEGYSYKEISALMGIAIGQVKVNLFRARKTVRENLVNINAYGLE